MRKFALPHWIPKTVCVSVNLHLEPHLSHQQEPRQLSKSHQMCSSTWLLCASCTKLTMLKFGLKNDLAPNYPNNLYCNLPWPKTELMFRAAQSSESTSFRRRWGHQLPAALGLACWRAAAVPRHNSGGFLCTVTSAIFHLISAEQPWLSYPAHLDNVSIWRVGIHYQISI